MHFDGGYQYVRWFMNSTGDQRCDLCLQPDGPLSHRAPLAPKGTDRELRWETAATNNMNCWMKHGSRVLFLNKLVLSADFILMLCSTVTFLWAFVRVFQTLLISEGFRQVSRAEGAFALIHHTVKEKTGSYIFVCECVFYLFCQAFDYRI